MSRFLLNLAFVAVALVVAASGALQCFWPEKLKEIQSSLPRGHDPESPLGRLLQRFQNRKLGLVYRAERVRAVAHRSADDCCWFWVSAL
jgi:hypothetical protein